MIKRFKSYFGSANLRKKLFISYSMLVLLPVLIFGMYSFYHSEKTVVEQTKLGMEDTVASIFGSLNNGIKRENDNIKYFAYNSNIRRDLEYSSKNINTFARILSNDVEPAFWYFITSDSNLDGIRIYTPFLEQSIGHFFYAIENVQNESWIQKSYDNFGTHWRIEKGKAHVSRALLDVNSSSRLIGVVDLEINLNKLTDVIHQMKPHDGGALLLGTDGTVISHSEFADNTLREKILTFIDEKYPTTFTETKDFIITGGLETINGWKLYYFRDRSLIDVQLRQILLTTFLFIALGYILLMILGSVVSAVLSKRILDLKHAAEEISKGNFNVQMDLRYDDEIGIVNRSFSWMQEKMNDMIVETYHLGLEKRKAEVQELQAKINPHFLYNSLSSIKWKAIKAGDDDIAEITGILAKFYRTTLNNGKSITTVANELDGITSYLEIQQRTHDYSFDVVLDFSEDAIDTLMPNFLLQPIVENAVLHGIDSIDDESVRGKIEIIYRADEEYLRFDVRNSCAGLSTTQLMEVLKCPSKGYGLHNVQERIRLCYNDSKCGIESYVFGGMVCFEICIAREMKELDL